MPYHPECRLPVGSRRLRAPLLLAGIAALPLACVPAERGGPGTTSPAAVDSILEVNVTRTPDRTNGQPVVAVDPRNPSNIVMVSTAHETDGGTLTRLACFVAHSQDGGRTWTQRDWPYGDRPYCGDPYLAVDAAGTFYLAYNRLGCPSQPTAPLSTRCAEGPGQVGVSRSRDGGRTWSPTVDTTVARSSTPRLRVDSATGYIYVVGGIGTSPTTQGLAVSRDHGLTWSQPGPLPSQPFGNQIAVHAGVVASATAMKVVERSTVPDQVRFWSSLDGGQTFTSRPVTDRQGRPAPLASGRSMPDNRTLVSTDPLPWVTADPTRRERFAIMFPQGTNLAVYVTSDTGASWSGPALIPAPDAAKPWIEYGPDGQLAVMWRTLTDDVSNVFSTISFDGGQTFVSPLQVNRAPFRYGFPGSGGDEWSRIMIHGSDAYITWADAREGGKIDSIMARVPLNLYRRDRR